MRVARIQWPDDMTDGERSEVGELETRVRLILSRVPAGGRNGGHLARVAYDSLERELFVGLRGTALAGRLRIVTDEEVVTGGDTRMGVRVRFTWTRHERERREAEARARQADERTRERRGVLSRRELEEMSRSDLDLVSARLREIERLAELGGPGTEEELRRQFGLDNPHTATGSSYGLGPRREELREFRREVLGEFRPPAGLSAEGRATYDRLLAQYAPAPYAMGPRPFAQFIAQQLPVSLEAVLRGYVARRREGDASAPVRGSDEAALEDLIMSRRPGDTFYFVAAPADGPAWAAYPTFTTFRADRLDLDRYEHGTLEERIAAATRARQAAAVDLLVRIVNVALRAREEAYCRALTFYAFARAALEPWARNPSPIELDIDRAPFGVDLEPAEDPTAARFALLEIER